MPWQLPHGLLFQRGGACKMAVPQENKLGFEGPWWHKQSQLCCRDIANGLCMVALLAAMLLCCYVAAIR